MPDFDYKDIDEDLGVNIDDVEQPSRYAPLPKATYLLQVEGWTDRESQAGNQCVRAHCKVLNPPTEAAPEGTEWRDQIMVEFVFTQSALWKLENFVRAIGTPEAWNGTNFRSRPTVGRRFLADVTQRVYTRKDGSEGIANEMSEFYPAQ